MIRGQAPAEEPARRAVRPTPPAGRFGAETPPTGDGRSPVADRRRLRLHVAVNLLGPAAFAILYLATRQTLDATWGLLGGSLLSLLAGWILERRIAPLPLMLGLLAVVSGGLALAFHSASVLKFEVTVHSTAVGVALLGTLACGLNPLKVLAGRIIDLTDAAWRTLGLRLGLLDLAVAAGNLIVWRTQSDAVWAAFKFPGLLAIHLLFLASQWPLIRAARGQAAAGAAGRGDQDRVDERGG